MSPRRILVSTIAAALFSLPASAADLYWDGTGTSWNSLLNWSTESGAVTPDPAAIPGAADLAIFNISTLNAPQVIDLNADQAASGLSVVSTGAVNIQGGNANHVLSLGTQGITLGTGGGAFTLGSATAGQQVALLLTGSQTWTNNSGAASTNAISVLNAVSLANAGPATLTLGGNTGVNLLNTISGPISDGAGTLSLTMTGAATTRWLLSSANTYSGVTSINSGALRINNGSALGSTAAGTTIASGAGLLLDSVTVLGESLTLTGDGTAGSANGALQAVAGLNRWTGAITANTGAAANFARIGAINSSTLTIDGPITGTGTGQLVFQTGTTGTGATIIVNGDISFAGGRLTKSTQSTSTAPLILTGTNNYGVTTISAGVLQVGNGGTTGTLGTDVVNVAGTLAFKRSDAITIANSISGSGALSHLGTGMVTLTGANAITGSTSITGGGTLMLDFTGLVTPTNLAGTGALVMTGSKLAALGKASGTSSQSFNGITLNAGPSFISADSSTGTATNIALGAFTRTVAGGTLELNLPTNGTFTTTTTNTNGIIGGYVTAGKSSWATNDGANNLIALPTASYSTDLTATGANLDVPNGGGSLTGVPNSVRFNDAAANTITLPAAKTITSGGILVTPNVGANLSQISGAVTLTTGSGLDLIVIQNNTAGGLTINANIGSSITKSGPGLLTLTGGNVASFTTRINEGTLSVSNASNLGGMGGTGAIVFPTGSTGILQLTGNNSFSSGKGFTLTGNGIIEVLDTATFNTVSHGAGAGTLTKTGAGTLIYSHSGNANTYTGATIINGGFIQASTLANGGANSSIGASTNDASNLVLNGGGLRYSAPVNAAVTDRLFTLGVNGGTLDASGGAGASVAFTNAGAVSLSGTNTARALTLTGSNSDTNILASILGDNGAGATSILKNGTGSWTLAGLNTFSGGTTVSGGTLFAGANGALGSGNVSVLTSAINLTISSGASNAIGNSATLSLAGDGILDNAAIAGYAFLASGVNETVGGLFLGGTAQFDPGTYGATGSGATHIFDDYFQGTGVVTLIPEPTAGLAIISGLGVLIGSRRMRRRS